MLASTTWASNVYVSTPLKVENRSPFIQHYGIARPDYQPTIKKTSETTIPFRWSSSFEIANYLSQTKDNGARLRIDGETWIWQNSILFPINKQFLLGINLPWVRHSEGYTDRFIFHFHDILQLPQNGRRENTSDQYSWYLQSPDEVLFFTNTPESSLGDIRFTLVWNSEHMPQTQWQGHIELPTGRFGDQSGNGGLDAGLSFISFNPSWFKDRNLLEEYKLSLWYGLGLSYLSHDKRLDDLDPTDWSLSGRTGIAWVLNDNWQAKVQLDSNTALFDTQIRELGWLPLQISFGGEYKLSANTHIQFSLAEDLRPRVTPDAIISFGLTQDF